MITDAELIDAARHRRWASTLVSMLTGDAANTAKFAEWIAKWEPQADAAIDAFCAALPDSPDAAAVARDATRTQRRSWGL